MDKFQIRNRTILVAGGGLLGSAISNLFASEGARVVLVDKTFPDSLDVFSKPPESLVSKCALDLSAEDADQRLASLLEVIQPLHSVIHTVGLTSDFAIAGYNEKFEDQTVEAWQQGLDVNLTTAFRLAKQCAPCMKLEQESNASIIFLSSIYGSIAPLWGNYKGTAMSNPVAYGVSKAGLIQMARYLATVLGPNIRVNTVSPGGIARDQPAKFVEKYLAKTPLDRMGKPEDVAKAVLFLTSNMASYITGHDLVVDGGYSIW